MDAKKILGFGMVAVMLAAGPASAQVLNNASSSNAVGIGSGGNSSSVSHGGNATGGSVGPASGIGSSAIVGSGNSSNTNIGSSSATGGSVKSDIKNTNTNVNGQQQGQTQSNKQKQQQGQAQGQDQQANNSGISIDARTEFDRYAPSIAAPALTAAGSSMCAGSWSGGLTGPMAGIAFGKTVIDDKCEGRNGYLVLMQGAARQVNSPARALAYENAALRVLGGESMKDALSAEGLLPAPVKSAKKSEPVAEQTTEQQVSSTNFGAREVHGN